MVDRDQLAMANSLNQQAAELRHGLDVIAAGGTITAVTWVAPPPPTSGMDTSFDPGRLTVTIDTTRLVYPPQMITAIREQLQADYDQIVQQLDAMGVTSS